jgi:hypothetical protein
VSVYRVTDLIGTSTQSWEDAASVAIKAASRRPNPPHPLLAPRRNRRLFDRLDRGFESAQAGWWFGRISGMIACPGDRSAYGTFGVEEAGRAIGLRRRRWGATSSWWVALFLGPTCRQMSPGSRGRVR